MEINNDIRQHVIADIKAALEDTALFPVRRFFNGHPATLSESELPAISVGLSDGEENGNLSADRWQAALTIRIYAKGVLDVDPVLDQYGSAIKKAIESDYDAGGLLESCNRGGFDYSRDEEMPWGSLDLIYIVEYEE